MNTKLLIVTTNFPPSQSIGTQRILKLCKFLSEDWTVHILAQKAGFQSETNQIDKEVDTIRHSGLAIQRTAKLDLYSLIIGLKEKLFVYPETSQPRLSEGQSPTSLNKKASIKSALRKSFGIVTDFLEFPDRDITWLPLAVLNGIHLINRSKIDILFTSGPRHSNLVVAMLLKRLTGRPLVVDFRDPWARSPWLIEKSQSTAAERIKHRAIQKLERMVVECADTLVFITRALRDDFQKHYAHLSPDKFKVYYNGYDPDRLVEGVPISTSHPKNYGGPLVFAHIGNLYKKRNPERLIRVIDCLIEDGRISRDALRIRFVGGIADDIRYVEALTRALGIDDVIEFIPPVDYTESFAYMQASDVLIILQPEAKLMLPAKFYDYICFDIPILALGERGGEVANMVDQRFGCFADYDSDHDMQVAVLSLMENPGRYRNRIIENRKLYDISSSIHQLERYLIDAKGMIRKGFS